MTPERLAEIKAALERRMMTAIFPNPFYEEWFLNSPDYVRELIEALEALEKQVVCCEYCKCFVCQKSPQPHW